ncbi:MAG: N-acetylmuramoyl-L-alanine amidase [Syntrophales bacterium]
MARDITEIIIHCAATPNGRPHTVDDIDRWHKARGFKRTAPVGNLGLKHIGYHYVIYIDGTVHQGRDVSERGAHAYGRNDHSIGICLIGTDKFTQDQWSALSVLVADLLFRYPGAAVIGHRELPGVNKGCPGFDVARWRNGNTACLAGHTLSV